MQLLLLLRFPSLSYKYSLAANGPPSQLFSSVHLRCFPKQTKTVQIVSEATQNLGHYGLLCNGRVSKVEELSSQRLELCNKRCNGV
jgi:hypothetical protein